MATSSSIAEQDAAILARYQTETLASIAASLGRHAHTVASRFRWLAAKGLVDPHLRYYHATWSEEQRQMLNDLYGIWSDRKLASHLHRTEWAIILEAKRCGINRKMNVWTAQEAGRLFGVDAKTVLRWVDRGWLAAKRAGFVQGTNRVWNFDVDAIEQFVRTMGWAYEWQRMDPDSYLTTLAREVARTDPWLTIDEAARELGWCRDAVKRWLTRGLLTCRYRPKHSQSGPHEGYIMIRRADLADFRARHVAVTHANRSTAAKARCERLRMAA